MQISISKLNPTPEYIIVDGNRFKPIPNIPHSCIIKGDSKYMSIAAASILAKTYRDEYMNQIHEEFPMYNWKQNKGYPTLEHREAIRKYGTTKYHRMSFRPHTIDRTVHQIGVSIRHLLRENLAQAVKMYFPKLATATDLVDRKSVV